MCVFHLMEVMTVKIMIVDDEPLILEELSYLCANIPDAKVCGAFCNPVEALEYASGHLVDFAFLDIRMPGITGLELLEKLHGIQSNLQAAFVTAYDQYALDAYRKDACDYILKPFGQKEVAHALEKARRALGAGGETLIEFRTFGRFDLFLNGCAVDFCSRKAKELLALLVAQKGGMVNMELAIEVLWEEVPFDEKVKGKFRKAVMHLRNTLKENGLLWMLRQERGRLCLVQRGVSCDYFRLLNGDTEAARQFQGEFMAQYSWSELFLPMLERQAKALLQEGAGQKGNTSGTNLSV